MNNNSELLTKEQAAKHLGVCLQTITNYVNAKRLRVIKRVRRVFFERADLDAVYEVSEAAKGNAETTRGGA